MKKIIAMILFAAAILCADDRSATAGQSQKPAAAASSAPQLPSSAVQIEPNLYRFTDTQGKTWLMRRTPFGFSKWLDKPAAADAVPPVDHTPPTKATDLGETVRFERATPFGVSTWVRKKTELSDQEKGWLAKSTGAPPSKSLEPADAGEKR